MFHQGVSVNFRKPTEQSIQNLLPSNTHTETINVQHCIPRGLINGISNRLNKWYLTDHGSDSLFEAEIRSC